MLIGLFPLENPEIVLISGGRSKPRPTHTSFHARPINSNSPSGIDIFFRESYNECTVSDL